MKTGMLVSDSFSRNNIVNAYPISIGLKSDQHTAVESHFIKERTYVANGNNNKFHCMTRRKNTTVYFEIITSLGDQEVVYELSHFR